MWTMILNCFGKDIGGEVFHPKSLSNGPLRKDGCHDSLHRRLDSFKEGDKNVVEVASFERKIHSRNKKVLQSDISIMLPEG